jgi:hypothetical protein
MIRNTTCLVGALIAGLGYGAYLTGHEAVGIGALIVSVVVYFVVRTIWP